MANKKNLINNENITHLFSLFFLSTLSFLVYYFANTENFFINPYYLFIFSFFSYEILLLLVIFNYLSLILDSIQKIIKENKMVLIYIIVGIISITYLSIDYYIERNLLYTLRTGLGLIIAITLSLIGLPSFYNRFLNKKKGGIQ